MSEKRDKFYITTSIPYLNGAPHLGHALEYVQADAIARYQRLRGKDVFFLTGSDEHGAKIVRAAEAASKNPNDFVDGQLVMFENLLRALDISHDGFVRTSDWQRHGIGAQKLWQKIANADDIYRGRYQGLYCVGHEAFVTEKDLVGGLCRDHQKAPERIDEENYLFRLSRYVSVIRKAIEDGDFVILPESRRNEALAMLESAPDVSFSRPSRDISWGIPVPGDTTQTMYVWCDALANYLTGIGYGQDQQSASNMRFWPADLHVIGKDVLRFHAIIWPAMLLSAGLPLPRQVFVHGWVHVAGGKMSKSIGNVVDPAKLIAEYGADALRFYLLHEIPTFADGNYTAERFAAVYNGLLVKGIGNVLSRTLKMINTIGIITRPPEEALLRYPFRFSLRAVSAASSEAALERKAPSFFVDQNIMPEYHESMSRFDVNSAIRIVWGLFHALDQHIEEYKIYKALKEKPEEAKIMLWNIAYALAHAGWMLKPFLPETAEKMLKALDVEGIAQGEWKEFRAGEMVHLFSKK
ncbi:hypothetical protein A3J56_02945 [Candidatus Giovannonibacteria bacterium RIFCSPHIGHO2_02_FULL_46_20]|uniref:methionine--tRNA ligase n=1 Tax=Candidatus Giovannonibacteria bacterium RIFCSPHIGHO2_02_FULL_46_20 TaxID=1798338 RepID=A0A1F5WDS6_9BACT|nr:MAG: hypothetical protein A3J56_02945 [Candidatus Giovannonibacteria bacterium RIFCSPHIGHO2_02_FULL_46_20]